MKVIKGIITDFSPMKRTFWTRRQKICLKIGEKKVTVIRHEIILFSCLANSHVGDDVIIRIHKKRIHGFETNSASVASMF